MKPIQAWHFVGATLRDGSPIPPDGVKLKYDGPLKLCHTGLHACIDPFDALKYAPGDTLCLVHCGGEIIHGNDKLVCSERTIIARVDATEMLRYYARMMALYVSHLYPNDTDEVVFDWLITGDETLRSAAWAAAREAEAAAWAAKEAAASKAGTAEAAEAAALAAAAKEAEVEVVREVVMAAAWAAAEATRAAGVSAAWAVAAGWAAAVAEFNALVYECFEDFLP